MTEVLNTSGKGIHHDDMDCSSQTTIIDDSPSAAKKLKQARLPFKPIGPKTQLTLTPHGLPKKRKLSDQESPSAKAAKVATKHQLGTRLDIPEKPAQLEHENEVSSSSEAENIPVGASQKRKGFENNILERFVRKSSQEEISSTNDVVDLTEIEGDSNASEPVSPVKSTENKKQAKPEEKVITIEDEETSKKSKDAPKDVKEEKTSEKSSEVPKTSEPSKTDDNSPVENSEDEKTQPDDAKTESTAEKEEMEVDTKQESKPTSEALNTSCKTDNALEVSSIGDKSKDKSLESSMSSSKSVSDESSSEEDNSDVDEENESMADVSISSQGNSSVNTSTCKTPKTKGANSSSITKTPGGSSVQTSTPKSTRGKPQSLKMSEIKSQEKKREREAMRQRVREQKEKERQERKQKKEQEKLEAKRKREEEKAERDRKKMEEKEKKEKERMEKKEQLEKEKMEKQQQKEEEKKKKQEILDAKLEEKKKKEEEKRLKEEEKLKEEEEKNKKKMKAKESFSSFFIKKAQQAAPKPKETSRFFMPFEVKKDMFLAPPCRRQLGDDDKSTVDEHLTQQECGSLYLAELKKPSYEKGSSPRTLPRVKDVEPTPEVEEECEGDVECLETTESAEKKKILERHHCKLLQFHTNYRPPYYGTWRKTSQIIKPTRPFSQDTDLLDYEVDSDDEWEEEEPGESVSSSEDEGEEKEEDAEEDEEEDGWMVPHGYLSEDEGCEQDEEITPELMKARQMAKQEAWEAEQKRQKAPVKAVVIGCHWDGEEVAERLAAKLAQFRAVCLSAVPIDTRKKLAETSGKEGEKNGEKGKGNRKPVPEEAMPDLIRLLHRNVIGIKKVIKEFRLYWKKKNSNTLGDAEGENMDVDESAADKDLSSLNQSVAEEKSSKDGENEAASPGGDDDKAQESADGCGISKRQLELKITAIAVREKRPDFKKVCWYVHDKILKQYEMEELPLVNAWQYVSKGLVRVKNEEACGRKTPNSLSESFTDAVQVIMKDEEEEAKAEKPKDQPSIMQFAKKMAPSELPKPKIRRIELKPANPAGPSNDAKRVVSPVAELDTSANEETLGPYKTLPKDQRSIMDFAKKPASSPNASKKPVKRITPKKIVSPLVKKSVKTGEVTSSGETTKVVKEVSPVPVEVNAVIVNTTPVENKAELSAKKNDEAMEVDDCIVLD